MTNLTDRLEALDLSPTQLRLALQIVQDAKLRSVTADRGALSWSFRPSQPARCHQGHGRGAPPQDGSGGR